MTAEIDPVLSEVNDKTAIVGNNWSLLILGKV